MNGGVNMLNDKKSPLTLASQTDQGNIPSQIIPHKTGMHTDVKQAFRKLRSELLLAMARDRTSVEDAEIYGHIHAHVLSLETIYEDILSDEAR